MILLQTRQLLRLPFSYHPPYDPCLDQKDDMALKKVFMTPDFSG
jgi:hypothetical protein